MTACVSSFEKAWGPEEFLERLKAGRASYHLEHPFQVAMNEGRLNRAQLQGWIANRFYYQVNLPRKDAAILANCPDRAVRRAWMRRLLDHEGEREGEGGIAAWIRLGVAAGLSEEEITSLKFVVPGVRFAVDAYVNFARNAPWQEAVCSCLTELFAGEAHASRLTAFPVYYPWIEEGALGYFRGRIGQGRRDCDHALTVVMDYFHTRPLQERALDILRFKLDVLWAMLDAIHHAYPSEEARDARP